MSEENPQNLLEADTKKNKIVKLRRRLAKSLSRPTEAAPTQAKKT